MTCKLFSGISSDQFIKGRITKATNEINNLPTEHLKETNESELIECTYMDYKLEPLILLKDEVDPARVNYEKKELTFIIPYTGSKDLFDLKPSCYYSSDSIEGTIYPSQNIIGISIPASDTETVVLNFEKKCKKIEESLKDIAKQCEEFNPKLRQAIEKGVKKRYEDIKNLEDTAKEVDNLLRETMKRT
jgi:hypothetical protein